ncbi:MAG: hypothetical protein U0326_17800 [Polyangiales bacterium]
MSRSSIALLVGLLALIPAASPMAGPLTQTRRPLLAQRGTRSCNTDADCASIRVPPPRACPHGGTMVATACCRMNYCGICWSDCPPAH